MQKTSDRKHYQAEQGGMFGTMPLLRSLAFYWIEDYKDAAPPVLTCGA